MFKTTTETEGMVGPIKYHSPLRVFITDRPNAVCLLCFSLLFVIDVSFGHHVNMPIQYTANFFSFKNDNFQLKKS